MFKHLLPRSGIVPAQSTLLDLGSGDGRVVLAAATTGGFKKAVGIEVNPWLVMLSRMKARRALWGLGPAPRFYWGNAFDVSLIRKIDPQVVTLYGRPGKRSGLSFMNACSQVMVLWSGMVMCLRKPCREKAG